MCFIFFNIFNFKRITNTYEYIHTVIPNTKYSISKVKPLSRAFFKLIEIYHCFTINKCINSIKPKSLHLAEAPGGFIEATSFYSKIYNLVVSIGKHTPRFQLFKL